MGSGREILIQDQGTEPAALAGLGKVKFPVSYLDEDFGYFDKTGTFVKMPADAILAHELTHALKGLTDNWRDDANYAGANVNEANKIFVELGVAEQRSYIGSTFANPDALFGTNYTNGNAIDTAIVGGPLKDGGQIPTDTSPLGVSRDLILGTYNEDLIIGGKGADYLYGRAGNDQITGDVVHWDDSKVALFTLEDDNARDFLYGGDGHDLYGVSGGVQFGPNGSQTPMFVYVQHTAPDGSIEVTREVNWNATTNLDVIVDSDGQGEVWTNVSRQIEENYKDNPGAYPAQNYVIGIGQTVFHASSVTPDGSVIYVSDASSSGVSPAFTAIKYIDSEGHNNLIVADGRYDPTPGYIIQDFKQGDFGIMIA